MLLLAEKIRKKSARENFTKVQFKMFLFLTKKDFLIYQRKRMDNEMFH